MMIKRFDILRLRHAALWSTIKGQIFPHKHSAYCVLKILYNETSSLSNCINAALRSILFDLSPLCVREYNSKCITSVWLNTEANFMLVEHRQICSHAKMPQ